MEKILLPDGYSCEINEGQDFTIYSPEGYFKMNGFPHRFWDAIYEYGDNSGRKWNGDGEPITENTPEDFDSEILKNIVGFTSVKQKIKIRQRVLEAYNKHFGGK